jgi:hypothetical protein
MISQTALLTSLSSLDTGSVAALRAHLLALPTPTATLSTLLTLTRLLLLYTASSIGASHLVLGTSLTSLSISLISSIAQGGGFVVPQTIQEEWVPPFVERIPEDLSWNGEVRLVRPLRDVSMKECQAWAWWHQLPVVGKQRIPIPKQNIGHLTKGRHVFILPIYFLRLTIGLQDLSLDSRETTLQQYLPSPKPLVNLRQRGNLANDVSCANCPRNRPFEDGRPGHRSAPSQTKPLPRTTPRCPHLCSPTCAILATRRSPAGVVEAPPLRVGIRQIHSQRCNFRCGQL